MPTITPQDSALLSSAQEALSYAPHTLGGMGTALISLGLVLWKTGILKGIMDYANSNKKLNDAEPKDKFATFRDVERLIRDNDDIIGKEYGTPREHQKEIRDLTELLNRIAQTQEVDREEMSKELSKLLDNSQNQAITIARIETVLRNFLPPEGF